MRFSLLAGVCLAATALAAPTSSHVVHERRDRLPAHWSKKDKIPGTAQLPMRIALTQNNLENADSFLMDVSHPESSNFGKHWTAKQVAEMFAPSKEAVASVLEWLADSGVSKERITQSQSLNWLYVNVTVSEAEDFLKTEYHQYTHSVTGQSHIACEDYSVPEKIQEHVDFITPTLHFDVIVEAPKKKRALDERELDIVKRQISAVGHDVQPGIGHTIGSPYVFPFLLYPSL